MVELLTSPISTKRNFFARYEANDMNPTWLTTTYYLPLQLKLSFYGNFYHVKKFFLKSYSPNLRFHLTTEATLLLNWVAIDEHLIPMSQTSSVTTTSTLYQKHFALLLTQWMQATALPPLSHLLLTVVVTAGNSNFRTFYSSWFLQKFKR